MKVVMRDNYDEFMKTFINKTRIIVEDETMMKATRDLLEKMCAEMRQIIQENRPIWEEPFSQMEALELGDDVDYELTENGGRILVGQRTQRIQVGSAKYSGQKRLIENKALVNPYLFIEFGWGIAGEQAPVKYAYQRGWKYNINDHQQAWVFLGTDMKAHKTAGRVGIDFFYSVINKYRKEWKKIFKDAILREIKGV